ncbi:hypothetical protein PUNSTDRAFT_119912 [Punctularia strigosozonata HHB-11173 SS5]|uniref:uncharacterized protein n=1 Tax=Punctularia strigosozonata (strain HHB-11173) TaxID=741275 RepID=UPI0004416531|nr:uncharacterized protein PUNSTDRAFT_119912 [Punctularia strigosozonata HHB-11173 SS5]EIN09403.1 hypothetical protein PUNSTDRAFT_119912 [Punctularia strigosozonata HHB-11173 SS5]
MAHSASCVQLPPGAVRVVDADEEVFLLYSVLASRPQADGSTAFRGLGSVDSRQDTLNVHLEYDVATESDGVVSESATSRRKSRRKAKSQPEGSRMALDIVLAQDKTALRSRKGDTGSVLWRASVDFAQYVLRQRYGRPETPLIDPDKLQDSHVLELGAGTGLLALAFGSLVRHYTVTDIESLMDLIRKNLMLNSTNIPVHNISTESLDWLALQSTPLESRCRLFPAPEAGPPDLVLVVDCIYHPSLLPALICTLEHLCSGGSPALIVAELRAEDVVREFLQLWLRSGQWEIWSLSSGYEIRDEKRPMGIEYVLWLGWIRKNEPLQNSIYQVPTA